MDKRLIAVIAALTLALVACGSEGSDSVRAEASPSPFTSPRTEETPDATPEDGDDGESAAQIVVRRPSPGDEVTSPIRIAGDADVFEATVSLRLVTAGGDVLVEDFTTATCGSGCRGDYRTRLRFDVSQPTEAVLEVFESSAEDGSPLHMVQVPLTLLP